MDEQMSDLPIHVIKNRAEWTRTSQDWVAPGRRSWEAGEITWGIWSVPEAELKALGELSQWRGKDAVELGCGTGYISAWLNRLGMNPIGVDITPAQLATAKAFQEEFGESFPLIEASAEAVPLPDACCDLAISEYGASIWCDPYAWIPEAARLLRPGGRLVFLRNSHLSILCTPDVGKANPALVRDHFGLHRVEYDESSVEFHLPPGPMIRLMRSCGLIVEDLIDIAPPPDATDTRFEYITLEWARHWPAEEIWVATKQA
jgi:SAM-dependent methyltransferase